MIGDQDDDDDLLFEEDIPKPNTSSDLDTPLARDQGSNALGSGLESDPSGTQSKGSRTALGIAPNRPTEPWKILIADDDPEVHMITRAVLSPLQFKGIGIRLLSAYSGQEAVKLVAENPDIAAVLLDVVMETEDAGLRVVHRIRDELHNRVIRIILRTGQPGQAPERDVIIAYDINDYKAKTELTAQKLFTTIVAAIRSYDHLQALVVSQQALSNTNILLERKVEERTAALSRSNRDLESFAYGVSHDLKEPLRTITGYVQLMRRRLDSSLAGETAEYMDFIEDGTARMTSMIDDLLDYARVTVSSLHTEQFDLRLPIERALANLGRSIDETHAVIRVPSVLPTVEGDATQLSRLFQNLLDNAIKYRRADQPPRIRINVTPITSDNTSDWPPPAHGVNLLDGQISPDGNEPAASTADNARDLAPLPVQAGNPGILGYCISILDNGRGIPTDKTKTIFDLFQRVSLIDDVRGTGIGLAVCRRVVELHGGDISVQSAPGEGCEFTIRLPARQHRAG